MKSTGWAYINFANTTNNYLNEGLPELVLNNGRINVIDPPSINISPDNLLLTVGDQHQFSVSRGSAPYTWSVTDPSVADISSTGLLSATHHGFTKVAVEDNGGIRDTTTGQVEIRAFKIWINDTSVYQGDSVLIPIMVSDLTGLNVASGKVEISFNGSLLEAYDISTKGTLLQPYINPSFKSETGKVNIAFAGAEALEGSGILCFIHFQASMDSKGLSALNMSDPVFNENLLGNVTNGRCRVIALPVLNVRPKTSTPAIDEMLPGYTLEFIVSGGSEPYTWSTTNPEVAVVDENGLLTAMKGGKVNVLVEDDMGAKGSSNLIIVWDTEINIPDTSIKKNEFCDLPVHMRVLPDGQEIIAFEATVKIDTTVIKIVEIITEGAICDDDWSLVGNNVDGTLKIAGATSSSVTGGGILFYIRFIIPEYARNVSRTHITFESLMLNEGIPSALASDGTITIITTDISDPENSYIAEDFILYQNFPNPFNPSTIIKYQVGATRLATGQDSYSPSHVDLSIFNVMGQKIATLISENQPTGVYNIKWEASDQPSGIYLYRLQVGNYIKIKKMMLIR
jgi:hypothetical protein